MSETKTAASETKMGGTVEVRKEFLSASEEEFLGSSTKVLAMNVTTEVTAPSALVSNKRKVATSHVFSHKIPAEGKATNQRSSGRCWLFAALNVMRRKMATKYNLGGDFELSQSFLFFWDKVERCNYFLEQILETAEEETDGRLVQHLLAIPMNDGGQWDMITSIIRKYGVVPQSVYPDALPCKESRHMNRILTAKLREFAMRLRTDFGKGVPLAELREAKEGMLKQLHHIILTHLGPPPTEFDWEYYDKDSKYQCIKGCTPESFFKEQVDVDIDNLVSVIHDPRNKMYATYTVDRLGNVMGGTPVLYVNLPIEEMKRVTMATIADRKEPVWFGCDVGKHFNRSMGALDLDLVDYDALYGTKQGMVKADRLSYGESLMTHAMVFTGFHKPEGAEGPQRWRVENSWGDKSGDKGYLTMTDAWFNEYMYQVVVDKSLLDERALAALELKPTVLPAWDPMGALAHGQALPAARL